MRKVFEILSLALSAILHPLFMPTYGMLLFCLAFGQQQMALPMAYCLIACIGTFVITAAIPLSLIIIQWLRGTISDIRMRNASERTPIYLYTFICYAFWDYFLYKVLHAPFVSLIGIGATMALGTVLLINHYWKISAHLTGIGGFIGGVYAYCLNYSILPNTWSIVGLLSLALILSYARLYVKAHTALQVTCGLLLGIVATFIPTLVIVLL